MHLRRLSRSSRSKQSDNASSSAALALPRKKRTPQLVTRGAGRSLHAFTSLRNLLGRPSLIGGGVALALALITVGVAVLWWFGRSEHWTEVWLPNIAAEAGGLAVAVVLVDLVLNALRTRDQQRTLAPEQLAVAGDLVDALRPYVSFTVWSYATSGGDEGTAPRDAADFVSTWHHRVDDPDVRHDDAWVGRLGTLLERVAASLEAFDAAEYHGVLTPHLISSIQKAHREAASYGRAIADAQRAGDPRLAQKVASDACGTIGMLAAAVLRHCNRITRVPATTEGSWMVWPVVRSFHEFTTEAGA